MRTPTLLRERRALIDPELPSEEPGCEFHAVLFPAPAAVARWESLEDLDGPDSLAAFLSRVQSQSANPKLKPRDRRKNAALPTRPAGRSPGKSQNGSAKWPAAGAPPQTRGPGSHIYMNHPLSILPSAVSRGLNFARESPRHLT